MPRVSIVVLNWNSLQITRECLQSLQQVVYDNFEVIVVDNGSSDGSVKELSREFPKVVFIENDENRGVAGGRNVGPRRAMGGGSDYMLILDNDTRVDPSVLSELVSLAQLDPEVGILGAKIYIDGEDNLLWGIGGGIDLKRCYFDIRGFNQPDRGQYDSGGEVPYVMGCAQMVRRRVIEKIGYLDEEFITYFAEDTDLCLRARSVGLKTVVAPRAIVWHKVKPGAAGSRTTGNDDYFVLKGRNLLYFMKKHATVSEWFFFSGYMFVAGGRAFVREVRRGNFRGFLRMVQGALMGVRVRSRGAGPEATPLKPPTSGL